jgi:hypothetical protein
MMLNLNTFESLAMLSAVLAVLILGTTLLRTSLSFTPCIPWPLPG